MNKGLVATATIEIQTPVQKVWEALITPEMIKKYMFGTETVSEWNKGSSIVWKGIWEGKPYEDKGIILQIEAMKTLQVTHFSPLSGQPDIPENYHTLSYVLSEKGNCTSVSVSQDNNANEKEKAHSQKMWEALLLGLKKILEDKG